ncbi:MAG TPA: PqiC family protein [Chthoniobacterales bacterium]|jgi:hypothetical protein
MTTRKFFQRAATIGAALLVAGCGGSSQQYFRLSAENAATSPNERSISLGVGPVSLPAYIDRSELVFQSGPNEFQIPSNASWAGSLRDNITAVLASDLRSALGAREVLTYPWAAGRAPARRVALAVRQFHGISGSGAILDVSWQIENADGFTIAQNSRVFHEPIKGDGYAVVVAAESCLLAQCAAAIARALR